MERQEDAYRLLQYPVGRSESAYTAPEGVAWVGTSAFQGAVHLRQVALPDTVIRLGKESFAGCTALEEMELGDGLAEIGSEAFYDCTALTQLALPATLTRVDSNFLNGASSMESVTVAEGGERYYAEDGVLFQRPYGDAAGNTLVYYPAARPAQTYAVPQGVAVIGSQSFWDAWKLTQVTLPEGLETIEGGAFTGCDGLTRIAVPDSVTRLGAHAFQGCTALEGIQLGSGLTALAEGLFYRCESLREITIPAGVTEIAADTFEQCTGLEAYLVEEGNPRYFAQDGVLYDGGEEGQVKLLAYPGGRTETTLTLPSQVTQVSYGALSAAQTLQSISVEEGNEKYYAQDGVLFERTGEASWPVTGLTEDFGITLHTYPHARPGTAYTVPEEVWTIADQAFVRNPNLIQVDAPSVRWVQQRAFLLSAKLQALNLSSAVYLGDACMLNCPLISITLPDTLEELDNQALDYCSKLEYIQFQTEEPPQVNSDLCSNSAGLRYVYVPAGSQSAYLQALAGKVAHGALIVEGTYQSQEDVKQAIAQLDENSTQAQVNSAAQQVVRLLSHEAEEITNAELEKVDRLFQAVQPELQVTDTGLPAGEATVSVAGAAVASGLVEEQDAGGGVSGTVAVVATQEQVQLGELMNLGLELQVNGAPASLQAPVVVTVELPQEMAGQEFLLYHRLDSGAEEPVDFTRQGDTVTFRTGSFSSFVFRLPPEPGILYQGAEEGDALLFAEYVDNQLTQVRELDIQPGQGQIPFTPQEGVDYRAFLLQQGTWAPTGQVQVILP